jgi:hypothetical protein
MKSGYLYVLVHPSDPDLYKVGIPLSLRSDWSNTMAIIQNMRAGSSMRWVRNGNSKAYIAVPDPKWAETAFWEATGLADIPFRRGIEVERMEWKLWYSQV